jgi:hypothetical protein
MAYLMNLIKLRVADMTIECKAGTEVVSRICCSSAEAAPGRERGSRLRRVPDLRLTVGTRSLRWRPGLLLRGLEALPVAFGRHRGISHVDLGEAPIIFNVLALLFTHPLQSACHDGGVAEDIDPNIPRLITLNFTPAPTIFSAWALSITGISSTVTTSSSAQSCMSVSASPRQCASFHWVSNFSSLVRRSGSGGWFGPSPEQEIDPSMPGWC